MPQNNGQDRPRGTPLGRSVQVEDRNNLFVSKRPANGKVAGRKSFFDVDADLKASQQKMGGLISSLTICVRLLGLPPREQQLIRCLASKEKHIAVSRPSTTVDDFPSQNEHGDKVLYSSQIKAKSLLGVWIRSVLLSIIMLVICFLTGCLEITFLPRSFAIVTISLPLPSFPFTFVLFLFVNISFCSFGWGLLSNIIYIDYGTLTDFPRDVKNRSRRQSEKDRLNIDIYRRFIDKFRLFKNRSEAITTVSL